MTLRLHELLPRARPRDAFHAVGLAPTGLAIPSPDDLKLIGVGRIVAAAIPAAGATGAHGKDTPQTSARRAAAGVCHEAGLSSSELATGVAATMKSARRLMLGVGDPALCAATKVRLAREERIRVEALASPGKLHPRS